MVLGYRERTHEDLEKLGILACWIINHSGFARKAVRLRDLLKPRGVKADSDMTQKQIQEMLDDAARFHKTKAWTKLSDKYAKKE